MTPAAGQRSGNVLGFDFGEKRIGVAVGQPLTGTATPLESLRNRNGRVDWPAVEALVGNWRPVALVVGNPLNMDGTRQRVTDLADAFARELEKRFGLPVHRCDERLSTYEARDRTKRQRDVDAVAAQVILESWLAGQGQAATADGNE